MVSMFPPSLRRPARAESSAYRVADRRKVLGRQSRQCHRHKDRPKESNHEHRVADRPPDGPVAAGQDAQAGVATSSCSHRGRGALAQTSHRTGRTAAHRLGQARPGTGRRHPMTAVTVAPVRSVRGGDFAAGARAMVPWLAGVAPFGLVIGVSAAQADIPTLAGWLTGPTIYAGSSQVAAIEMLDAGSAPVVVVITALVINLRLILYSGAIATYWRGTPRWWRALAAYLLVDPSFVVGIDRYQRPGDRDDAHTYYLGGAITLWVTWLLALRAAAPRCRPRDPRRTRRGAHRQGGKAMSVWLAILVAGLGSYLFRISMVMLADRVTMPEKLERASTFVAPAAFAALAAGGIAAKAAGLGLGRGGAPATGGACR